MYLVKQLAYCSGSAGSPNTVDCKGADDFDIWRYVVAVEFGGGGLFGVGLLNVRLNGVSLLKR